ncbi:MAG TPA: PilZ domain-containing protein [Polyangiales bacterium]|nr:PilZ domain-containing protein [Polyangiales bacterium]
MQGRKSTRASVPLLPRYRGSTGFEPVEGQCLDISVGGMFIASTAPLDTGTLLKFECQVDGESAPIKGVARVVWQRTSGERDRPSGMGLKFVKLEPGTAEVIERLIREAQLQGMTAPTHPLPANYSATDSFPPGEGRLSSSQRLSVVSATPIEGAEQAEPTAIKGPESGRVPAGTTPRDDASAMPVLTTAQRDAVMVSASRLAILPGEQPAGSSNVPERLRSAARWISLALAVVVLAWSFLR